MDKAVKKDITRRYKALKVEDNKGETNTFVCSQCNNLIRTVNKDAGVVPMGIECPFCHSEAYQQDTDNKQIAVTYEWYRPTLDEVLEMAEANRLFSVTMILHGGLVRRDVQGQ